MAYDTQTIALIGAAFLIILLLVLILIRQSRSHRISATQIEQLMQREQRDREQDSANHLMYVQGMLHDQAQVLGHFSHTLMIARELVAWGPTAEVFTEANWQRAQGLHEPFDDRAPVCDADEVAA